MQGVIIKGIGGFYYVKTTEGNIVECKARGKFRFDELTPVVGDKVQIKIEKDKGVIEKIQERRSILIRPLVANITQAFVVFAAKDPDLNLELLFKFLLTCEMKNIKSVICLNKMDLVNKNEFSEMEKIIDSIGYEVVKITANTAQGLEELSNKLDNNITVLCGPSGVGKSTLLNGLLGRAHMETGAVSKKIGRGKHTTRHSELIEVNEGLIVDTPGFSTVELEYMEKENLQFCFPEFNDYLNKCRFNSCLHDKEPSCMVKEAVSQGKINEIRYNFYLKILQELEQGRNKKWQK